MIFRPHCHVKYATIYRRCRSRPQALPIVRPQQPDRRQRHPHSCHTPDNHVSPSCGQIAPPRVRQRVARHQSHPRALPRTTATRAMPFIEPSHRGQRHRARQHPPCTLLPRHLVFGADRHQHQRHHQHPRHQRRRLMRQLRRHEITGQRIGHRKQVRNRLHKNDCATHGRAGTRNSVQTTAVPPA